MPVRRALLAVLLGAATACAAEVNTLKPSTVTGEIVSISDKEVVVTDMGGEKITIPIDQVLHINYAKAGKPKADDKYSDVELIDGTILHCREFLVKKDLAVFTPLTTGQEVTTPLTNISNVLLEAHLATNRQKWDAKIAQKRLQDVYVSVKGDTTRVIDGTFTHGNATGKEIEFTYKPGDKVETRMITLADAFGIIFARGVNPNAKPVICKLTDVQGTLVYVSAVASIPGGVEVTTSCGVKVAYTTPTLAKLDYTSGKIEYLSDLKPTSVVETSPFDAAEHYQINRNLDGGPIKLEGKIYPNGLAAHAYTELEYDLKGKFREFKALVGVDDVVGGHDGPTSLRILGDNKELANLVIQRKDRGKAPKNLAINIKDVQKLKIIIGSGDLQDIGKHVNLADAKVTK